ncbi:MAG: CocE/NonD family hydrolase [Candidatus Sumerlaeia bacterium]|nr:CocE/NonD family hydrolase [Candidatus Sumerlaeia bacterium]
MNRIKGVAHKDHRRGPSPKGAWVTILAGVLVFLFASLSGNASAQRYEEKIKMRDGKKLATDIYRNWLDPFDHPVILIRTPYGKRDTLAMAGVAVFTQAGYIVVVQDIRGTGSSEGNYDVFQSDGWGTNQDGYDTIKWIADQWWCDGNVGMFGVSALGIAAYLAAGARPSALKAEVVAFAAADLYDQAAYQGGQLRAELIDGWVGDLAPERIPDILNNSVRTSFWDILDCEDRQPQIKVPTLHIGGWYDCFLQGTINHFAGLQIRGDTGARGKQKMIIGPWTHGNFASRDQGELTYPSNSINYDVVEEALDWFDYWLKGENNGAMDGPKVKYYIMGDVDRSSAPGNEWAESDVWPPTSQEGRLYLWAGKELWGVPARGPGVAPETFRYNPNNPVPTKGGANLEIDNGPYDQRSIESRSDVLVYTSPQLTEPLEITGRVWVELYASSSAVDTDWTARLCDVYPDGRSMLVCDGILRARCRDSTSSPTAIVPHQVYRYMIDLWSTSIAFNTGHRIRLIISSSNSRRFEPNRNNGLPPRSGSPVVAYNTIYHDAARPSALLLPVTRPAGQHPVFRSVKTDAGRWTLYR